MLKTSKYPRGGFTLIELLVVVLIIGILAAIALPQYKKAVYKSKYVSLRTFVSSLRNSQQIYLLSNGHYTENLEDLDITLPDATVDPEDAIIYRFDWGWCYSLNSNETKNNIACGRDDISMGYYSVVDNGLERRNCLVLANSSAEAKKANPQNDICKSETGRTSISGGNTNLIGTYIRYQYP